ncbi:hypothetical protein ACH5RR_026327 [Cinchona calisaya]|uniref:Uncharacterized protein n=1 Tax=Cinchona calisaya TaxID=153742 RepID=A0ABD2Z5K1_9GENT
MVSSRVQGKTSRYFFEKVEIMRQLEDSKILVDCEGLSRETRVDLIGTHPSSQDKHIITNAVLLKIVTTDLEVSLEDIAQEVRRAELDSKK